MPIKTWMLLGASALALTPGLAFAQQATPEPDQPATLDEIVVTAQKRTENLQDVPISVTAVDAEALENAGITKTSDLAAVVPGLVFTNTLGGGVAYIRGIGQTTGVPGAESPVGVYIDGVYLVTPASGVFEFNNISRIEVLRGPQGTLFGRNTTGGLINIITRDPGDSPSLDADIGYGNFDSVSGHFYGETPVAEGLSTNLSVFGFERREGFGRNVTLGIDLFKEKNYGIQNKWLWRAADGLTDVTLNLLHSFSRSEVGTTYGVPRGSIGGDGSTYLGQYLFASSVHEPNETEQNLVSLRINHELDWASFMSVSAYHTVEQDYRFAQLGYDNNSLAATNPFAAQYPNLLAEDNTFTQELQLSSPEDSRLQWITGLFYMHDDIPLFHSESKPNNVLRVNVDSTQQTESIAAFAQATWPIADGTRVTAGLRHTTETKEITGRAALANGVVISTPANPGSGAAPLPPETTWRKLTYRLSIDHDFTDDILGYASYNFGFKGGVYNLAAYTNQPANPETVRAFEAGVKSFLFDRRLRFNVAGFYNDYEDIQLRTSISSATGTFFATYNAASAEMYGVDVDFEAQLSEGLNLSGGFEVLSAEYKEFPRGLYAFPNPLTAANLPSNCLAPAAFNPVAGGNTTLTCDLSGNRMIRSPDFTANLGINYRLPLASGAEVMFNLNDAYNSGFYWDPENRLEQEAYHNLSASVTWTAPSGRWDVQVWGKNLGSEDIWSTATGGTSDTYSPGLPLTFGIRLGVHL